ncbi:unnamed protein product [Coffea canephora]|uniref:Uncharacterized protein n=1 Tax=Coffea canephora TaxID=49390 RepID=A0A068UJP4_COFCA|nr:unnamed protein product [Coffea canephora]
MNPGPLTRSLVENGVHTSPTNDETGLPKADKESISAIPAAKIHHDYASRASASSDMRSQATSYAKLAESKSLNPASVNNEVLNELTNKSGLTILPVSAESARLLPNRKDTVIGSDIVLEAVLDAEVARNTKDSFSQPQNLEKLE